MMEFGKTLREAREAKGYTIGQLADVTHLMHQIVEDMENENFSKIAAPIYGRGFVKIYCEAVGLDPKPLIAEYMAIANGERATTIHVRKPEPARPQPQVAPVPPPPPAPAPEPPPAPRPQVQPQFDSIAPSPAAQPAAAAPARFQEPGIAPQKKLAALRPPSPLPHGSKPISIPKIPANTWRIAVVVGVAAVLLWALALGAKALYNATMSVPEDGEKPAEAVKIAVPEQPVESSDGAERTPITIPPLYID